LRQIIHHALERRLATSFPLAWVPNQATLVSIGILLALWLALRQSRAIGLRPRTFALGLMLACAGAVVGAKAMGNLERVDLWWSQPSRLLDPNLGGATSFGALLGGAAVLYLYLRRRHIDPWHVADTLAPLALLGLAFARLGCFLQGCDYGRFSQVPWAVRFPRGTPAFAAQSDAGLLGPYQNLSLPLHPFQLYLVYFDLALVLLFIAWPTLGRRRGSGRRAFLLAATYFSGRFALELARAPSAITTLGPLNLAQWLAIGTLLGLAILFYCHQRRACPAPPWGR